MKNRIIASILSALLLLSATACSTGGETDETADRQQTQAVTETDTAFFPDVAKNDYNGAAFRIISEVGPGTWYYAEEYMSTGNNISVLNNTLYEMNTLVEDHLNVSIEFESNGDLYGHLSPIFLAGDDTYQLVACHGAFATPKFITSRYALDFYELDDLDLDQFYWDRDVMELLSINDKAYVGFGDICHQYFYVLYCNKDMLHDVGIEVPYNDVREGTWTLDKFVSMTTGLYQDDGDGLRNNKDIYGYASAWAGISSGFLRGCDIFVLSKNDENDFELSLYNDRFIDAFDKFYKWSQDESVWVWDAVATDHEIVSFGNGQAYFTGHSLSTAYLSSELSVGILPVPKYDEAQENYRHINEGNPLIVPYTVRDKEMVGQVMELMSFYSGTMVLDKYYDEVLQLRVSEAPDDRDMVELVYATSVFDPAVTLSEGSPQLWNLAHVLYHCVVDKNANIASFYRQNYKSVEKWLSNLEKKLAD